MIQLIKTQDKFILISDEDWVKGDWYYTNLGNIYQDSGKFLPEDDEEDKAQFTSTVFKRKIIAGIPELPSIDFSLLKEEDCKTIGFIDVEKLAEYHYGENRKTVEFEEGFIKGFNLAYNQCLEDNKEKRFSLEDMKEAYFNNDEKWDFNSFIELLQQTSWDVEVNELNQITKIIKDENN